MNVTKLVSALALTTCLATTAQAASFHTLLSTYSNYDRDGDGANEIESLQMMNHTWGNPGSQDRVVVVFVEGRLLDTLNGSANSTSDLVDRLETLANDLRAEGYNPKFVDATVFSDPAVHQDGKTLLAMRDFLKDVRTNYPNLEGALLIGSFPEATLVRRWLWKKTGTSGETINGVSINGQEHLRMIPERIDARAEIVLADLDGNWDQMYREASQNLDGIRARPTSSSWWQPNWHWSEFDVFEKSSHNFEDFFFINDSQSTDYSHWFSDGRMHLWMSSNNRHQELTSADKALANPMARPDILVSRINPRHIAVEPDPNHDLLDANGKPRISQTNMPNGKTPFVRDAAFERTLLIDFLDRNHKFRRGTDADLPYRAGAITYPESDFAVSGVASYADSADPAFGTPLTAPTDPSLVEYVEWLQEPAVLRAVTAHSNAWNTEFGDSYSITDLYNMTGNSTWRWKQIGNYAHPSFDNQGGHADLYLHRTLWENGELANSGSSFFIHTGCETNTPGGSDENPYDSASYGGFQNGEAQLFYLNGLAMISRAKVFYDRPLGIDNSLAGERTAFGEIWPGTFDVDAADSALEPQYASNKRAYNWSLTGDWTLRMKYDAGLGLFTGNGWRMESTDTVADNTWIDGWNYSADDNAIHGAGDFDGDGVDEALVTSAWGIGVFEHDGTRMRARVAKPDDTWFGSWRYNASHHSSNDVIEAIGDFDGDGDDDVLVTSEWGMGVLRRSGSTFYSVATIADNTFAGGWRYETHNDIVGVADLNGDGKDDIIVSSGWGIGVLNVSGSGFTSLVVKPNDTWFGSWRYNASTNSGDDTIEGFGDFDGDGDDDILISSSWGIGILRLSGNTFYSMVAKPNDTWFGDWRYNASIHRYDDRVMGIGDLDGDGADDIVMGSEWGIGVLERSGTTLVSRKTWQNGTSMGHWTTNGNSDRIVAKADLTNDGRDELVMQNPYTGRTAYLRGWGTGGYTFYPLDDGDKSGNYVYRRYDNVVAAGNLDPNVDGEEVMLQR